MSILFPDTPPEITAVLLEMLRKATPTRKLEMVGQMNRTVKIFMLTGLKDRYPNDTPEKLRRRLADLILGPELAEKAYGAIAPDTEENNEY
jgi:hypothetical protein